MKLKIAALGIQIMCFLIMVVLSVLEKDARPITWVTCGVVLLSAVASATVMIAEKRSHKEM